MQDPEFVRGAFEKIAPRYASTNHVLSFGIDVLWRRRAVRELRSRKPALVLDLATGSGDLMAEIRRGIPGVRVAGADFCVQMMHAARRAGLGPLLVADAMRLPFAGGSFDAVTVAFGLRNMESWVGAAREMHRVIRPGGTLCVLDFSLPAWRPFRSGYLVYLKHVLPCVAGLLTGHRAPYAYLARSIEKFPSGRAMCQLLEEAGYQPVRHRPLSGGIASLYLAEKPGHEQNAE